MTGRGRLVSRLLGCRREIDATKPTPVGRMVAASAPSYSIGGHKENPYIPIPQAMQRPVELGSHPQSRTALFTCIAVTLWIVALSAAHAQIRAVSCPLAVASHLPSGEIADTRAAG